MLKLVLGCGYLGQRVARRWCAAGHRVVALTRSADRAEELAAEGIEPVIGDVRDPQTLAAIPDADSVLIAIPPRGITEPQPLSAGAPISAEDADAGELSPLAGFAQVIDRVAQRVGRLVFISSVSVYGQNEGEWVDEDSPTRPLRDRGRLSLATETLVRERFRGREGGGAIVLRLAGIYGPGRLLRRVDELRAATPITGDPEGWLNLIHVDDAAAAVLAAESGARPGSMWIVADDRPVRRREYYELLASLLRSPRPVFRSSPGAARTCGLNKRCSNRRLREELKVTLRFPTIADGLPHALTDPASS